MQTDKPAVGYLTKVVLEITAGSTMDERDLITAPVEVAFIFGVGCGGLSLLECALEGKPVGTAQTVAIHRAEVPPFLARLLPVFSETSNTPEVIHVHARVAAVSTPDNREVVRALANSSICGAGCDCGCGGH